MINISGVFAPLLILFVLIGGALILIRFISKHFPAMRRKERWLLPIYGAVLVACGIILTFLEPFEERTASGEEERLSSLSLYSYIESGNIKKSIRNISAKSGILPIRMGTCEYSQSRAMNLWLLFLWKRSLD